jgi:hypothetical protein
MCEGDAVCVGALKNNTFGNRVTLKGLKARPELNGFTGRCRVWLADNHDGRYQ